MKFSREKLLRWPETAKIFFKPNRIPFEPGERLVQTDLARSLGRLAKRGASEFYQGEIARRIVQEMKKHHGRMNLQDLKAYKPVMRQPIQGTYRGYTIFSMPPPSSGGIHLIQLLNMLEAYPIASFGHNSSKSIHLLAEVMKLAYADRSQYLGDPDFFNVPQSGLTSKDYAAHLRKKINMDKATPSNMVLPGTPSRMKVTIRPIIRSSIRKGMPSRRPTP